MGKAIALGGAVLILLSAVGVVRFTDVLARMHALTKASTIGVLLVAVGAAFVLPTANDITSALAAALLQLLTLPIAASLIARATYLARGIPSQVDAVDEYADDVTSRGAG
jgi:multicomponent Na+:H+ antiporter subunit G